MKPLVSVIMPAYNAEKYIGKAIESIISQTYDNWELIIVDDGSRDRTYDVAKAYENEKVRIYKNATNNGISATTNRAIRLSKGEYLALHDDDDLSYSYRLEKQVDYLEKHKDISVLGGGCVNIDEDGNIISMSGTPRNNPKTIMATLLFRCMDFRNGTALIRKKFFIDNDLWYKDNCLGMQDYFFYIEASKVGKISTVPMPVYMWRCHSTNETSYQLNNNNIERSNLYSSFRKESLESSGYKLKSNDLDILNYLLPEQMKASYANKDIKELKRIFMLILEQARTMEIDYYNELEWVCKKILTERILRMDLAEL